jgi:endonuclease III
MENSLKILKFLEVRYGSDIDNSRLRSQGVFELLIETVLSQRTRDENSERAAQDLFRVARTPKQILKLPTRRLEKLIRITGPYRQKAKRLKIISKSIIEDYGGAVPDSRAELMKLYGVGYKTADIVLMYGFNIPSIAVDTHCNRIPKRIGLIDRRASVEEVKACLEDLFPRNKWYLINIGLVRFGKEICKPVNPVCIKHPNDCPFSGFCRAYKTKDFKV